MTYWIKKIEPIFSRVNGVAQVDLVGGQEREIQVNLDEKNYRGTDFQSETCNRPFFHQT